MAKYRKYTIISKDLLNNVRRTESFINLKRARVVGIKYLRLGIFIKLTNVNNIILPLM